MAISANVLTWGDLKITLAIFEDVLGVGAGRHVVGATNKIEDVLAVIGARDRVVAGFEAEGTSTDKQTPVVDLCDFTAGGREAVGEDESSQGISR